MNEQGEGIVDELIRYLDANKRIFSVFGAGPGTSMTSTPVHETWIPQLVGAAKFRLPVNGRIYRDEAHYQPNKNGKFSVHMTDFELDMMHYTPYELFTLEYETRDTTRLMFEGEFIDSATPDKVVVLCNRMTPFPETKHCAGIGFKLFEYRSKDCAFSEVGGIPAGWATYASVIMTDDPTDRPRIDDERLSPRLSIHNTRWTDKEQVLNILSVSWMEVAAIAQTLVALNAKHGVTRDRVQSKPRKPMTIRGRRLGYEYHVLDIDPQYLAPAPREGEYIPAGHHASPRFHMRRAHVRRLPGKRLAENVVQESTRITFVKQCAVGSPVRGVIEKDYRLIQQRPEKQGD
jgi:hypothetical protein